MGWDLKKGIWTSQSSQVEMPWGYLGGGGNGNVKALKWYMPNQDVMVTIVTFHCNYCVDTKMVSSLSV